MGRMSAEVVGRNFPPVVTLDDLTVMNARYRVVGRDAAQTVRMFSLRDDDSYEQVAAMPLARLLRSSPAAHLGDGNGRGRGK
jgi:hypothetical protein